MGANWPWGETGINRLARNEKSSIEAVRRQSELALISVNFIILPRKPQKRLSQIILIFTGSMKFGSSDFWGNFQIFSEELFNYNMQA